MVLFLSAFTAAADDTNPPPATYIRSYINDVPDQPEVTVTVTGAVSVACLTIEEDLPGSATPTAISGDGVWLPAFGAIRWGPYFDTPATNVSYRLTGPAGSYPVNGGSWMDGHWYFSPGVTMVTVLPPSGGSLPQPQSQLPSPIFMPPSGAGVPVNVVIGMPGGTMTLLDDIWDGGDRTVQNPPYRSAWFVSGSGTNLIAATNALTLWPNTDFSSQIGILNLDATQYGDYRTGVPGYPLTVSAGNWQFQLVSPDLDSGATYWAWEQNPDFGYWTTLYTVDESLTSGAEAGLLPAGPTPQAAFAATINAGADKLNITLTNQTTLHIGVADTILGDNLGGISLRVMKIAPVLGITYFAQNTNTPIRLQVGDGLRATLKIQFSGPATAPYLTVPGLRLGLFNFSRSALSPNWVSADGFDPDSQGNGVPGYSLFQYLGAASAGQNFMDIRVRTNLFSSDLLGTPTDYSSMNGSVTSNNFPAFVSGRDYLLTLQLQRLNSGAMSFNASWLDTVTGGTLDLNSTNDSETNFTFDGLALRAESLESTASNIIMEEFKVDYLPAPANGLTNLGGVSIYFTLDGTAPSTASMLYTGAVSLATSSVIRAGAFASGCIPSASSVAYYGLQTAPAVAKTQVTRTVDESDPTAPLVTFNVTPGTNAACVTLTESLPLGLAASSVTAGGNYLASNNVVEWGPFFGTNAQSLRYQAVGLPGIYPVQASWSVDGVGGGETEATNIIVSSDSTNSLPTPPSQVAAPVFTPLSGANVPVYVTISCATPGATIYYTLDGSLPMQGSTQYTVPIDVTDASTIRAVAFTNGWTPSVASVAYYGPPTAPANAQVTRDVDTTDPTAPVVTFNVTPGAGASCVAVTETLPPGLDVTNVTAGGSYLASNNVVLWGPFFGTNALVLSYVATGLPGTYPVQAYWSVDGVGGSETLATTINVASPFGGNVPTPPPQEPVPTFTPTFSSTLPTNVLISSSDPQAQIYFATDGTLPTQGSTPYTSSLTINAPTTLRAVAFRTGYLPSVGAVGYYGNYAAALPTNSLSLARSISGSGNFLPSITLTATPQGSVNCYAVTETIVPGLTPFGLADDAVWNPASHTISWGPYLDNQPRALTYTLSGPAGTFPLSGQGSFDGYPATVTGVTAVTFDTAYIAPPTNYETCLSEPISYDVDIDPAPGIIVVDSASGTVDWGDGTQSAVTEPVMTIPKFYAAAGNYTITLTANWSGHTATTEFFGNGSKSDGVEVYPSCVPVITNEPFDQVVLAGTTAQFSVGVSSYFPVSYQWYFNEGYPFVSPATFATLALPDVTPDEAGYYSVQVTSAYGSTNSTAARLTVVTASITSITRDPDGSVTLNFLGLPNTTTRIWASTNLSSPTDWEPIYTNDVTNPDGTWEFTDTNAVNFGEQFYRFSTP